MNTTQAIALIVVLCVVAWLVYSATHFGDTDEEVAERGIRVDPPRVADPGPVPEFTAAPFNPQYFEEQEPHDRIRESSPVAPCIEDGTAWSGQIPDAGSQSRRQREGARDAAGSRGQPVAGAEVVDRQEGQRRARREQSQQPAVARVSQRKGHEVKNKPYLPEAGGAMPFKTVKTPRNAKSNAANKLPRKAKHAKPRGMA